MTMRRWFTRSLIVLLITVAMIAIVAHLILRSDLPKRIVIDLLQQETGLRIEASDLRTSWLGRTSVHDLTVALPLEADPFLRTPEVNVRHTALLWLILTRSIDLDELIVRDAEVTLRTNAGGQWNLVEAAERINQAQARRPIDTAAMPDALPRLRITDAVVNIETPDGSMIRYAPFNIQGDPYGAFAWRFSATMLPHVRVDGRLSPTAPWAHEIEFELDEIHRLIVPWLPAGPNELRVAGRWTGQIKDESLDGRLALDELRAAPFTVRGEMNVSVVGFDVTAEPIDLRATIDDAAIDDMRLTGGRLRADVHSLRAERLVATINELRAQVDAQWNLYDETGSAIVEWETDDVLWGVEHAGRLNASLSRSALGRYYASAKVNANGRSDEIRFATDIELAASGEDWRRLRGSIIVNQFDAREPRGSIQLGGTRADVRLTWPDIHLRELQLPGGAAHDAAPVFARGEGSLNLDSLQWSAAFDAKQWQAPGSWQGEELPKADLAFVASGDFQQTEVQSLTARVGDIELDGSGSLTFDTLVMNWSSVIRAAPTQLPGDLALGEILAHITIDGTLAPMQLNMSGDINVDHTVYQDQRIDEIMFTYQGEATLDRIDFALNDLELFGGSWRGRGSIDPKAMIASIELRADAAQIAMLADFIELPLDVHGSVSAELAGDVHVNEPHRSRLFGSWTLHDFGGGGFEHVSGEGMMRLHRQKVELYDMQLHDRGGVLSGQVAMDLNHPDRLHAAIELRDWPWAHQSSELDAIVHGRATLDIDLTTIDGFGELDLAIDLAHRNEPLGRIDLDAELIGRRLVLTRWHTHSLDTTVTGAGELVLDEERWMDSHLTLDWEEFDLATLSRFDDALEPLRGISSGSLTIRRDDRPRAHEPMRLDVHASVRDGSFREVTFGRHHAHPNRDGDDKHDIEASMNFSPNRAVLHRVALQAIDGEVVLSGRLTKHDGVPFAHLHLNLNDIDLQQIVHIADITTEPTPGRVSGIASIGGYLHEIPRRFGRARVELSQSDLVSLPGFAQLFSALRLDIGTLEPTGEGVAHVRLEGPAVDVTRLTYFNRGTDVIAQLRIEDLARGQDSDISGMAVGVVRPLADVTLPFFDILDRLIYAVQQDATSLRISGTVREPVTEFIPLPEIAGSLRRLFGGRPESE